MGSRVKVGGRVDQAGQLVGVPTREQLREAFLGTTRRDHLGGNVKRGMQHADGAPEGDSEDSEGFALVSIVWGTLSAQLRATGEGRRHEGKKARQREVSGPGGLTLTCSVDMAGCLSASVSD